MQFLALPLPAWFDHQLWPGRTISNLLHRTLGASVQRYPSRASCGSGETCGVRPAAFLKGLYPQTEIRSNDPEGARLEFETASEQRALNRRDRSLIHWSSSN